MMLVLAKKIRKIEITIEIIVTNWRNKNSTQTEAGTLLTTRIFESAIVTNSIAAPRHITHQL